ncbi:MAG: YbhB/YbcL family Raf kinase inhibitor-like protein [bacterium]|nr:YbhB/YbcL family Raf kinase inhibitor-like protein [bacterium]
MEITSFSFEHNGRFPTQFTCDGPDENPDLSITKVPEGAKSLTLLVDDPDAPIGNWDHWVVWNIDPATELIEKNSVPGGAVQGLTTFGHNKYGGPCPHGGEHRYFFKLYALDIMLDLPETSTKADVEKAMEGHVLDEAVIVGLYSRT